MFIDNNPEGIRFENLRGSRTRVSLDSDRIIPMNGRKVGRSQGGSPRPGTFLYPATSRSLVSGATIRVTFHESQ